MSVQAVSHIAVGVRDMERSLAFYRDILGLHVSLDTVEEIPALGDTPAFKRRGVYLRWREGPHESFIVLDQSLSSKAGGAPPALFQIGTHHWGLWVEDVDAIVERAEAAGVEIVLRPSTGDTVTYGEAPGGSVRAAFLRDPDGNVVQLDQRA